MNDKTQLIIPEERKPLAQREPEAVTMFERMARDPSVDIEKLQALLLMQKEMKRDAAEQDFNLCMSDAQAKMTRVVANKRNTQTGSDYADYAALDRMARPIYTECGFALSFNSEPSETPDYLRVLCYCSHRGGFSRTYCINMPADGKGAKGGDVMTKTHATGSAFQYGMRYLLKGIFNLAIGKDDDGNSASARPEAINADQAATIRALLDEVRPAGVDAPKYEAKFLKTIKLDKLENLPALSYAGAVAILNAKKKAS